MLEFIYYIIGQIKLQKSLIVDDSKSETNSIWKRHAIPLLFRTFVFRIYILYLTQKFVDFLNIIFVSRCTTIRILFSLNNRARHAGGPIHKESNFD
jgi:hypothetical protein